MVDSLPISTLEYQTPVRRYRPRAWKAVVAVLLPWFAQAIVTLAMYWSRPDGRQTRGWWLWGTLLLGLVGGCVVIARSGFRQPLKGVLLVFFIPIQLYCLFMVMEVVAWRLGATDAF
jgi:FtsH-binding integral membrane protein